MSTTQNAAEALSQIENHHADAEVRTLRRCDIGLVPVHQGDIYVHRVPDDHPRGKLLATKQLALGESMGQRHFVEGDSVEVYDGAVGNKRNRDLFPLWNDNRQKDACTGRLFVTRGPCRIPHPEHARHDLLMDEPGTYQVTHQWSERMRARVED